MTVAVIKDAGKKTDEQACHPNLTHTIKERVRINLIAASPCFGACEYKSGRRVRFFYEDVRNAAYLGC